MEVRVTWMEGEVFRLSQRMRYRIPSTPVGRSEFLLRAPPSNSKVCLRALSLSPPREILYVMPLVLSGVWHMSLGWRAGLWLARTCILRRGLGRLPCCDCASTKRAAPRGARCCAAILVAHPVCLCCAMASHGAHASLRHAHLRGVQKRPHAATRRLCAISFVRETCHQYER